VPKIDIKSLPERKGSSYPAPFHLKAGERIRQRLGDAGGLGDFGVNLMQLPSGSWSSQRHWHSEEDEFIWVVEGEVVLVADGAEQILRSGDCAGFKAGVADGHHLQNRAASPALVLEIGSRRPHSDRAEYPDIDLRWTPDGYTRKDGSR